jgi:glucosylceramidase
MPDSAFAPAVTGLPAFTVNPLRRYQRIAGFGGAFNERGWAALLSLSPVDRQGVLRALFDPVSGAGYSLARTPIGASDYALDAYSLDDVPGDQVMRHFSIARDRRLLLPYIHAALAINPALTIWASPWSAPAWMKTNQSMIDGGSLIPADEPAYARYLAAYVRAYAAAGVDISAISVQNEPSQATYYPSMVMLPGQMARFVARDLGPLFARLGLHTAIRVNEEPSRVRWSYSLQVLADAAARPYISGSDIHGYNGSPAELQRLHQAAPGLDIWQTEAMNLDHPHLEYADAERWAQAIARDLQSWAAGWEFWNMVTDSTARSSWGWQQDAVVLVDTATGTLRYTPKYYAMAHFSRFIRPGAYRIGLSGVPAGLAATAALNPDGHAVLVVVNTLDHPMHFAIRTDARWATAELPAQGIATFVWQSVVPR